VDQVPGTSARDRSGDHPRALLKHLVPQVDVHARSVYSPAC